MLSRIEAKLGSLRGGLAHIIEQNDDIKDQNNAILEQGKENGTKLDQILLYLTPPLPVGFVITITTGESQMADKLAKFGKMKLDILDNGTAKAVASPVDSVNIPTTLPTGTSTPVWTASDPGVVIAPDPSDPTGLTALISPATPPVLVNAFTVTVDAVLPDGSTHITQTSSPNNVVAGGPTGFQITVS